MFQEIMEDQANFCMKDIKPHSAPGNDDIPTKFVKYANNVLTSFLTKLFNKCFHFETFPDTFKKAYVIPIPKVSTPKTFSNFRPISLLYVFSKLFEKIIDRNKND